jgi:hypothetical protein
MAERIAEVVGEEKRGAYVIAYGEYVVTCKWDLEVAEAICSLINVCGGLYQTALIAADLAGEILRVLKAIAEDKKKDVVQL